MRALRASTKGVASGGPRERSEDPDGSPLILIVEDEPALADDSGADKVAALEIGADDYTTKPFSMRRAGMGATTPAAAADLLTGGPVEMDVARHVVHVRGEPSIARQRSSICSRRCYLDGAACARGPT